MDTKKLVYEKITELEDSVEKLIDNNQLNIDSIESIAINSINEYKEIVNNCLEEIIYKKINEKELITKKNKSGEI